MFQTSDFFNEIGRFIRYISPVIIMIVEILIYRFAFDGKWNYSALISDKLIAVLLSFTALLSGVFISFLYQGTKLGKMNYIQLLGKYEDKIPFDKSDSKSNSFAVMSGIWYSLFKINKSIEGASVRSQQLSNNLHGSGASLVSSILGIVIFIVYIKNDTSLTPNPNYCLPSIFAFVLLFLHYTHFQNVKDDLRVFVETSFNISQIKKKKPFKG